jgi:septum site-determining protein MinC
MASERIIIKGTSEGLIVTLGAGAWPSLVNELDQRLAEKASFFKGGRVGLAVGPRQLTRPQLETVGQVLNRHSVTLWAVESESAGTREAAAQLGLEIGLSSPVARPTAPVAASVALINPSDAILVQRTLRSGQIIHHPGHIVVIGDVNPGAEIRAGGSVVVWGRLRGKVHAGAGEGPGESAVVCALQLTPTQLRIGEHIAFSPGNEAGHDLLPEMASVQEGQIVAEPWLRKSE